MMISAIGRMRPARNRNCAFTPLDKKNSKKYLTGPVRNTHQCKGNFSNGAGFTLLELLLVVSILVILAGFNLPALKNTFERLQLEDCALNILSLCRYAHQKAILDSKLIRLNFDLGDKTYWLSEQVSQETEEFAAIRGRFAKVFKIPARVNINLSQNPIAFYTNGDADDATIILAGRGNRQYRLEKAGAFDEFQIKKE